MAGIREAEIMDQGGQGDVGDPGAGAPFIPSAATTAFSVTRALSRFLDGISLYLPFHASVAGADAGLQKSKRRRARATRASPGIALPRTPDEDGDHDGRDPIHAHVDYLDHRSRLREHRRRRTLLIIWSSAITSLVVLAYALDVETSWAAAEKQWAMMAVGNGSSQPSWDPHAEQKQTRLWGHSHNDEMHGKNAFSLALGLGLGSIEVDTYLQTVDDGSSALTVGHLKGDLHEDRTLQSVYLDPITRILDERNSNRTSSEPWVGLLADDPRASVQLVIDFKTDGLEMWPFVMDALRPLKDNGYLTTYSRKTGNFTHGPLTVIGTGETPLSQVYYAAERVIFYDAPLRKLQKPVRIPLSPAGPAIEVQLDHTFSPMASAKFPLFAHIGLAMYPSPTNPAIAWMKRRTAEARRRGIESRWWGAASQPKWVRRRVWAMMKEAQTDWINGDNLHDLARWLRRTDSRS